MPDSEPLDLAPEATVPSGDGHAEPAASPVPFSVPRATHPRPVPKRARVDHPSLFFNRELSWLDFNWRVLAQSFDDRTPLLERLRFLAIAASNFDEFFRKRVGALKMQHAAGVASRTPDGRTPEQQLVLCRSSALTFFETMNATWQHTLAPLLAEHGVEIVAYERLDAEERRRLDRHFQQHVFPVLTPLAVDPGHPFPFISDLSLSFAVQLRHPKRGTEHFARLKVPTARGRWLALDEPHRFLPLEDLIRHNMPDLFRGMEIVSAHLFRITRSVETGRDDDDDDGETLVEIIEDELRERRFAPVVRLEVEASMPSPVRALLQEELGLSAGDVYESETLLDLSGLMPLANLPLPDLQFPSFEPVVPVRLSRSRDTSDGIFGVIREGDLLVHHPFESFRGSVQRFLEEAAADEQVVAIKQTLYRTSDDSPIVAALMRAAEAGKQVAVLVEVQARFDEANNLEHIERLEKAGVHVTYGVVGLKTHAKVILVVREEEDGLRTYSHFGTGNYHPRTARLYTDLGLFTARPELGSDLVNLFHYLTGYAPEQHYKRLLVAPRDVRKAFIDCIRLEAAAARRGEPARIVAKMNALDDVPIIEELYKASVAGVEIDLIIRGHCRLRPGLERFSSTIRVRSILGRFLEHSRVFYFENGGEPRVFIGSADWQRRNLDDRVETIVEVDDEKVRNRLVRLLGLCLDDTRQSWTLAEDGTYTLLYPKTEAEAVGIHNRLMERAHLRKIEEDAPWDIG